MQRRIIYGLALATALVVCVLFVLSNWHRSPSNVQNPAPLHRQRSVLSGLDLNSIGHQGKQFRPPESEDIELQAEWTAKNERGEWVNNPMVVEYFRMSTADPSWDWRRPISFWGVVVDQHGDPVQGATVHCSWNDLSPSRTSEAYVTSGDDGLFSLNDKTGKILSVSVAKEGFRRCRSGYFSFEYANPSDRAYHRPDPDRPVVFRLIKKAPPEPTVQRERMEFRIPEGQDSVGVDLLGQRAVGEDDPSVDLVVHAQHGPITEKDGFRWLDWRVVLSVPGGGLQVGTECPPLAPEEGYQPNMEFSGKVEGRHSLAGIEEWFFLKSRNGQYFSRIHLGVSAAPEGGGTPIVRLRQYVLNPSGSRNLEAYPEMNVESKFYVPRGQ